MIRELKFKVWDNINKSYLCEMSNYYWHVPFSIYEEDIEGESNLCSLSEILNHPDKFTVQQCTGLKDIDNKEIYEGDLVELHTGANDHAIGVKENHYGLYEIYWDRKYKLKEIKPNWFFKISNGCCAASLYIMKVVGNVFETPELLK